MSLEKKRGARSENIEFRSQELEVRKANYERGTLNHGFHGWDLLRSFNLGPSTFNLLRRWSAVSHVSVIQLRSGIACAKRSFKVGPAFAFAPGPGRDSMTLWRR